MCISKPPKAPAVKPAPVAPAPVAPIEADESAKSAGDEEKRRRQAASGRSGTVLTSGTGLGAQARTGGKKLLGE